MSFLLAADLSPSFVDQVTNTGGLIVLLVAVGLITGIVLLVRWGRKPPGRD